MTNSITRRNFLKLGCAAIGGAVLACGGLSFIATREPVIEIKSNSFGGNVSNKILVAYASKSGSTIDVAQTIGKSLADKGASVDVLPMKSVKSVDDYRAVVIGSGIRVGNWLPEAVEFVKANQAKLNQLPVAFFTVHLLNLADDAESKTKRELYTESVRKLVTPKTQVFFAGRMDYSKLSFFEAFVSKMLNAKEEDLRDWNKIRAWAESVHPTLATL